MDGSRQSLARNAYWLNFAIALLLYAAAFAKVASTQAQSAVLRGGSLATFILATFETTLATWLLVRRVIVARSFLVTATFAIFFSASLWSFVTGKATCGCFGDFEVPPPVMALIDAAVLIALTVSAWRVSSTALDRRLAILPLSASLLGGVAVAAYSFSGYGQPKEDVKILDTKDWPGKTFPIDRDISGSSREELRRGSWIVLLYHTGCPKCSSQMQQFRSLAMEKTALGSDRLAAIQIPPYAQDEKVEHNDRLLNFLKLRDDHEWFVATPQVIYLRDGLVLRVADHLDK